MQLGDHLRTTVAFYDSDVFEESDQVPGDAVGEVAPDDIGEVIGV